MIEKKKHQLLLKKAYQRLASLCRKDGTFLALNLKQNCETPSLFPTLYCGHIVVTLNNPTAHDILEKINTHISKVSQKQLFSNYWGGDTCADSCQKYPDDMDDMSLALELLLSVPDTTHDDRQKEEYVSTYSRALKMTDTSYGGPFNTWILEPHMRSEHWHNTDIVVQAHIASCLTKLAIIMPGIISYIDTCIIHDRFKSHYYDSEIAILYAISSNYQGLHKVQLRNMLDIQARKLLSQDDTVHTLNTARLLSSLILVDGSCEIIEDLYDRLICHQDQWEVPYPLYIERILDNAKEYVGCPAVTLASIIQAMELYEKYDSTECVHNIDKQPDRGFLKQTHEYIISSPYITSVDIRERISLLLDTVTKGVNIRKIIELPAQAEASLMPYMVTEPKYVFYSTVIGLAGWAAWMHADTIMDEDDHDSLSLFTILLSIFHDTLRKLNITEKGYSMIASIIGTMEQANFEEIEHSSNIELLWEPITPRDDLGLRERTSAKSIAASTPLLALIMHAGADKNDIKLCTSFFTHFLRARQLSDDALDWQDDMGAGRCTLVTRWIEQELYEEASMDEKIRVFDDTIALRVAHEIHRNIGQALESAENMSCFTNVDFLAEIVDPYLESTKKIIDKYKWRSLFKEKFWKR